MTQESNDVDGLVRARIRGLRLARSWSLDELARRCHLSPSTISRIETGKQRVNLEQLTSLVRELGSSLDALVESVTDDDVVIRPHHHAARGITTWLLNDEGGPHGTTVAKIRITRPAPVRGPDALKVHPGRDWFTVLSGAVTLLLGERTLTIETGQAASFSTMVPHAFGAAGEVAEILAIFDREGQRTHLEK